MVACSAAAATCLSAPGSAAADPSPAPSTALGTGNGPYGTEYACRAQKGLLRYATRFQKRAVPKTPFYGTEEIFGAKNSLLWYATHLQRCAKRHPVTPNASSKARRTADSTDCGQPPAALDAFQRRAVPKAAPAHRTQLQCAKEPPLGGD